tara:strand:- start:551 stop:664 length:114 start_codon:yes stop_codon:yes gene_type:complete
VDAEGALFVVIGLKANIAKPKMEGPFVTEAKDRNDQA